MSEQNVARLKLGFERFERTGVPDFDLFDPEVELINFDAFPLTRPYHGVEGVIAWLTDMSEPFDDFRFELVDVLAYNDHDLVTSLRASGNSKSGGPPFDLTWAAVYSFRDGKLFRVQGLRTAEEALEVAGLS